MPIILLLLYVFTCVVTGLMGTSRRLGFWLAFLAALIITPIGGALLVILSGRKDYRRKQTA